MVSLTVPYNHTPMLLVRGQDGRSQGPVGRAARGMEAARAPSIAPGGLQGLALGKPLPRPVTLNDSATGRRGCLREFLGPGEQVGGGRTAGPLWGQQGQETSTQQTPGGWAGD